MKIFIKYVFIFLVKKINYISYVGFEIQSARGE